MSRIPPPGYSATWPHMSARRRAYDWWSSTAYLAEDAESGKTLGPAAIMDFSRQRYAGYAGFWAFPEYAATDAATGKVRYPSAIMDFSGDRYAG